MDILKISRDLVKLDKIFQKLDYDFLDGLDEDHRRKFVLALDRALAGIDIKLLSVGDNYFTVVFSDIAEEVLKNQINLPKTREFITLLLS